MENIQKYKRIGALITGGLILLLITIGFLAGLGVIKLPGRVATLFGQPLPVKTEPIIPDTTTIQGLEARFISSSVISAPLNPKNKSEEILVPDAVLTPMGAYALVAPRAREKSPDALLVFVKSLGVVTREGKGSSWQVVFASKKEKKAYEFVVYRDGIISEREFVSNANGAHLPENPASRDINWALGTLAGTPQFLEADISAINLAYNADAKQWDYVIANTFGNTAVRIRP